jgi:hypothetical protein
MMLYYILESCKHGVRFSSILPFGMLQISRLGATGQVFQFYHWQEYTSLRYGFNPTTAGNTPDLGVTGQLLQLHRWECAKLGASGQLLHPYCDVLFVAWKLAELSIMDVLNIIWRRMK